MLNYLVCSVNYVPLVVCKCDNEPRENNNKERQTQGLHKISLTLNFVCHPKSHKCHRKSQGKHGNRKKNSNVFFRLVQRNDTHVC
jgi:hypothetical protein